MLDQLLIAFGAALLGALGTVHLVYTFLTNKLHPYDTAVSEDMKKSTLVITRDTTMWKAWLGFNASHSLGAMFFAAVYVPLAVFHIDSLRESLWLSTLPAITGLAYLTLAARYWFRVPLAGISIATACFLVAAVLMNF